MASTIVASNPIGSRYDLEELRAARFATRLSFMIGVLMLVRKLRRIL